MGPLISHVSTKVASGFGMASVENLVETDGDWLWARFETVLPPYVCLCIAAIRGTQVNLQDAMVGWKCCADGKFSVSSAYQVRAGQVAGGEDKDSQQ
ncbi:hypothetical protein V6N13_148894 [Hibiscus sabdariffa]